MGKAVVYAVDRGAERPFVYGGYFGDGAATRIISLGFMPSFVGVWNRLGQQRDNGNSYGGVAMPGFPCGTVGTYGTDFLSAVEDGFQVRTSAEGTVLLNHTGSWYYYLAFR